MTHLATAQRPFPVDKIFRYRSIPVACYNLRQVERVVYAEDNDVSGILSSPIALTRWGDHIEDPASMVKRCESYSFGARLACERSFRFAKTWMELVSLAGVFSM